jgi:hypothetical protein
MISVYGVVQEKLYFGDDTLVFRTVGDQVYTDCVRAEYIYSISSLFLLYNLHNHRRVCVQM